MAANLHGTVLGRVWQIFGSGRCRSFRVNEDLSRTPGVTLPAEYGNWKTVYGRHRRWSLDGTWEKILDRLRADCDGPRARTGR